MAANACESSPCFRMDARRFSPGSRRKTMRRRAASRAWGAAPPCVRQILMPVIAAFLQGWPVRDEWAVHRGILFAATRPAFKGALHPGVAVAFGGSVILITDMGSTSQMEG